VRQNARQNVNKFVSFYKEVTDSSVSAAMTPYSIKVTTVNLFYTFPFYNSEIGNRKTTVFVFPIPVSQIVNRKTTYFLFHCRKMKK